MTDRHDSPPLTRRELRERERQAALAGRDPSWQRPVDRPGEVTHDPADQRHGSASTADEPSTSDEQGFEPKSAEQRFEEERPSAVPAKVPAPSHSEYQESYSAPPARPAVDSQFAPAEQPSRPVAEVEHTMTRRQLRELRTAEEAQRLAALRPDGAELSTELLAEEPTSAAEPDGVAPTTEPGAQPGAQQQPAAAEQFEEELPTTEFLSEEPPVGDPVVAETISTEPDATEPDAVAFSQAQPQAPTGPASSPGDEPDTVHPRSFHPPTGHWSIAAGKEDQPSFEEIIAGPPDTSGYGAVGSTLVLPSVPSRGSAWGAMGKSGEELETGSIDLPTGLSTTGEHARYDTSALDRMFDEEEVRVDTEMVHAPGSEPVRASSAVSSYTPTGDVVAKTTKTSHRLPMALAISAGALAVGVVGLFAAGAILGYF